MRRPNVCALSWAIALFAGCARQAAPPDASFRHQLEAATSLEAQGKHDAALGAALHALGQARKEPGPARSRLEEALLVVGREQMAAKRFDEARATLSEALPIVVANHPQGPEQRNVLRDLSQAYYEHGDVARALHPLQEALALARAAHADQETAEILNKLAWLQLYAGEFLAAKASSDQALQLAEDGHRPLSVAKYLRTQARALIVLGKRDEAERVAQRALALDQAGPDPKGLAVADDDAALGDILTGQTRRDEALVYYQAELAIEEAALKPGDAEYVRIPNALFKLANVFCTARDFERGIPLYEKSIALHQQIDGVTSLDAALVAVALTNAYMLEQDFASALRTLEPAISVLRDRHAVRSVLRPALKTEATILFRNNAPGFRARARELYERLAEEDRVAGDAIAYASDLQGLGLACMAENDRQCTLRALQGALDSDMKVRPPTSVAVGVSHALVALGHYAFGEYDAAVDEYGLALEGAVERGGNIDDFQHIDLDFQSYLDALSRATRTPRDGRSLAATSFMIMQREQQGRAALALARMAARAVAGQSELPQLIRRDQDLSVKRAQLERAFAETLSAASSNTGATRQVRDAISAVDDERRRLRQELASFPAYHELVAPPVVAPELLQATLHDGELLIAFDFGPFGGFVWALNREGLTSARVDMTDVKLKAEVQALREGLEPKAVGTRGLVRRPAAVSAFDRSRAFRLYTALLGPVAKQLQQATELIFVPSGALQSLPLGVLVTRDPGPVAASDKSYRESAWLIREKAIMVLPSVSSLVSLRGRKSNGASQPFIGVGNPTLSVKEQRSLKLLPNSEQELRQIAAALGAHSSDVYVEGRATEDAVKAMALDKYRVISFATHALAADELPLLGGEREPAIVLSQPAPGDHEDGFLTASEIATMKLDADWVVLSACNTAGGDGSSRDEALSGLARAFFYAGARSLLASHWSVYSEAAAELTTKTFAELGRAPHRGRAQALRSAMLAVMKEPLKSDPAYWGPFSFVGDGGATPAH
ncbi:MAG: CHAT domain-containing tetratricopeptide repeat protein [Pseudomonadota bacterium]